MKYYRNFNEVKCVTKMNNNGVLECWQDTLAYKSCSPDIRKHRKNIIKLGIIMVLIAF